MSKNGKGTPPTFNDPFVWGRGRPSFDPEAMKQRRALEEAKLLESLRGRRREGEDEVSCVLRLMDESVLALYASTLAAEYARLHFLLELLIRRIRTLRETVPPLRVQSIHDELRHFVGQVEDELARTNASFKGDERVHLSVIRILFKCLSLASH